jgi:hypothetical protein
MLATFDDATNQLLDGLRLIALRNIIGYEFEIHRLPARDRKLFREGMGIIQAGSVRGQLNEKIGAQKKNQIES